MITINSREEEDERPQLETLSRLGLKILAQGEKNGGWIYLEESEGSGLSVV